MPKTALFYFAYTPWMDSPVGRIRRAFPETEILLASMRESVLYFLDHKNIDLLVMSENPENTSMDFAKKVRDRGYTGPLLILDSLASFDSIRESFKSIPLQEMNHLLEVPICRGALEEISRPFLL